MSNNLNKLRGICNLPEYIEPDDIPRLNQGWVCPKCGRVFSPYIAMCNYCGNNNNIYGGPLITYSTFCTHPCNYQTETINTNKDISDGQ